MLGNSLINKVHPLSTAWYDALQLGVEELSPRRTVNETVISFLTAVAGYSHPIFTDATFAASTPLGKVPLPGGMLIGFMGGLVEHCAMFQNAPIVLIGFENARFFIPVTAGDTLMVRVKAETKEITKSGSFRVGFGWSALNQRNNVVASVEALFALISVNDSNSASDSV